MPRHGDGSSSEAHHPRREAVVDADPSHPNRVREVEAGLRAHRIAAAGGDAAAGEGLRVPLEAHIQELADQAPVRGERPFRAGADDEAPRRAAVLEDLRGIRGAK